MSLPPAADWTHTEEERLRAIVGRATIDAVKGLSTMVGMSIMPATWGLMRVPVKDPPVAMFSAHQGVYCVTMGIHGDLMGTAFLAFSVPSTETLMDNMLRKIASPGIRLEGMMQSALEEVGNIFLNEFVKAFGSDMKMDLLPATPRLEQGSWGKIWERISRSHMVSPNGESDVRMIYADFAGAYAQKLGHLMICLSPDSWQRLQHWANKGKALVISVGLGAMEIATSPTVLKAADLGSCVALTIYDFQRKVGGMAHVMLPKSPSLEYAKSRPGKYSDTAVEALIEKVRPGRNRLSIWLIGGSDMITPLISSFGSIGTQNADALREELKRLNLKVNGHDLGGTQARTVELMTETGDLTIRNGQRIRKESLKFA